MGVRLLQSIKPQFVEIEESKSGRFECTITREYYGIREKEVEALRIVKALPNRKKKEPMEQVK